MNTLITLANGDLTAPEKLRHYFETVFAAEESGEEFAVNLSHVWRIGYGRKDNAVAALRKRFVEGIDYQSLLIVKEREIGATTEEVFNLTVSCAEYFAVRANREVFEVYRNCRKAVKNILRGNMPDFSDPVAAARAWADSEERKRKALAEASVSAAQLAQARPKIEFADAVAIAANAMPIGSVAKYLRLPGVGRTKLFAMLRRDKILQANNEPYQSQIDAGHFEVELQVYAAGQKGKRTTGTTRCTSAGLLFLSRKYKATAAAPARSLTGLLLLLGCLLGGGLLGSCSSTASCNTPGPHSKHVRPAYRRPALTQRWEAEPGNPTNAPMRHGKYDWHYTAD